MPIIMNVRSCPLTTDDSAGNPGATERLVHLRRRTIRHCRLPMVFVFVLAIVAPQTAAPAFSQVPYITISMTGPNGNEISHNSEVVLSLGENSYPVDVEYSLHNVLDESEVDTWIGDSLIAYACTYINSGFTCEGTPSRHDLGLGTHTFDANLFLYPPKPGPRIYIGGTTHIVTVVAAGPPDPPGLLVLDNAGEIGESPSLSWGPSPTPDVSYNVYRCFSETDACASGGGVSGIIATTNSTNYTDSYVDISTQDNAIGQYSYWVTATNDDLEESEATNTVSTWGNPIWVGSFPYFGSEVPVTESATATLQVDTPSPETYTLHQNYPNPFNPDTEIRFDLPEAAEVTLIVYDMMGREVDRPLGRYLNAGSHSVKWQAASRLPSGMYLYHLRAGLFSETRKMTLVK